MKVLIVSGGHIDDDFTLDWMKANEYEMMIAADAGMDFLYRNKIIPDVIAGDFDSVNEESYAFFSKQPEVEIIRLNPIKDDTDGEFVIREAIRRGASDITILGATGTRLDHVLGNMYLLGIGLEENVPIRILDAHNRIRMIEKEVTLIREEQFGKYVSFLPVAGAAKGVTLKGFKYTLNNAQVECFSSLGISNEIVEETASVSIAEGCFLMIESRD